MKPIMIASHKWARLSFIMRYSFSRRRSASESIAVYSVVLGSRDQHGADSARHQRSRRNESLFIVSAFVPHCTCAVRLAFASFAAPLFPPPFPSVASFQDRLRRFAVKRARRSDSALRNNSPRVPPREWKCRARERSRFTRYSLDAETPLRWVPLGCPSICTLSRAVDGPRGVPWRLRNWWRA